MGIAVVRTHLTFGGWRNWVFVQVETDEGLTGLGEATLEGRGRPSLPPLLISRAIWWAGIRAALRSIPTPCTATPSGSVEPC